MPILSNEMLEEMAKEGDRMIAGRPVIHLLMDLKEARRLIAEYERAFGKFSLDELKMLVSMDDLLGGGVVGGGAAGGGGRIQ